MVVNGTMAFRLAGENAGAATAGYDQFSLVGGTLTLGSGSTLSLALDYTPATNAVFTLIDNEGATPIDGTFAGLAEGADFIVADQEFSISYIGGDGNDIVLTDVATVPEPRTYAMLVGSLGFLVWLARRRLSVG